MKFIKIIFLSILSTSVAVINRHFFCKRHFLVGSEFSKSLLFFQNNNENKSVYYYTSKSVDRFKDEAAKLIQEAAEIELSLREEARAKGVPEEMINKLIPMRAPTPLTASKALPNLKENHRNLTAKEIRYNLGYLNTGDAIRMTSELERIKSKHVISKWNSKDLENPRFVVNNYQ